jgi:hypothetical protein
MAHVFPGRLPVRKHPGIELSEHTFVHDCIIEHGSDIANRIFQFVKHFQDLHYRRDYSGAVG